jgi:membrane protein DedA with SNARE-associated domain
MADAAFVQSLVETYGWLGIVLVMAIDGAGVPLPGHWAMPLAGWILVAEGGLGWPGVLAAALCGAVGCTLGASVAYALGASQGRSHVDRRGRWLGVSSVDLQRTDEWFARRGELTVVLGHLLPVPFGSSLISVAAGVAGMGVTRFLRATFLGAFMWCASLTAAGYRLGPAWEHLWWQARWVAVPIIAVVIGLIAWCLTHRLLARRGDPRRGIRPLPDDLKPTTSVEANTVEIFRPQPREGQERKE